LIVNNYYQIVKIETFIKNNRLNNVLVQKMESEITLSHKYQGMIVGAAIGDALGMPVENLSHQEIKERYGIYFQDCFFSVSTKIEYLKYKFLNGARDTSSLVFGRSYNQRHYSKSE